MLFTLALLIGLSSPFNSSSVAISVEAGNSTSYGTGTVVAVEGNKSIVITNAHVVPDNKHPIYITYKYIDGEFYKQECTYINGSRVIETGPTSIEIKGPDIAVLEINCRLNPVRIAKDIPSVNTRVKMYGYGGNLTNQTLKEGKIIPIDGWVGEYTRLSIQGVNGDSGSGVLNDNGELVAVFWGGASVRLDTVKRFVKFSLKDRNNFKNFIKELDE